MTTPIDAAGIDISPEKVARYAPATAEDWRGMAGGIRATMRRETNGGYVNFADYEALAARLAGVEAERDATVAEERAFWVQQSNALVDQVEAAAADRDRLAKELAEARAFIARVADVEWQADEPASDWCQGEDANAYVAEMEHYCNWTVKDARDLLADLDSILAQQGAGKGCLPGEVGGE